MLRKRSRRHVVIREMRPGEARAFLEVHHAAVRGLAAMDYSPEVIDAWAPMPILDDHIEKVRSNPEKELRLIAELDGRVIGIGSLIATNGELRACYVAPAASRRTLSLTCHEAGAAYEANIAPQPILFELDAEGNNVFGCAYRAEDLRGTRAIGGHAVKCVPPDRHLRLSYGL